MEKEKKDLSKMENVYIFIKNKEKGICECCNKVVFDDSLYVLAGSALYHLSCYNKMKQSDKVE